MRTATYHSSGFPYRELAPPRTLSPAIAIACAGRTRSARRSRFHNWRSSCRTAGSRHNEKSAVMLLVPADIICVMSAANRRSRRQYIHICDAAAAVCACVYSSNPDRRGAVRLGVVLRSRSGARGDSYGGRPSASRRHRVVQYALRERLRNHRKAARADGVSPHSPATICRGRPQRQTRACVRTDHFRTTLPQVLLV